MKQNRQDLPSQSKNAKREAVNVPHQFWEDLLEKDIQIISEEAPAELNPPNGLIVSFLGQEILVDRDSHTLNRRHQGQWKRLDYPLLELVLLVYFIKVGPYSPTNEMVSAQELKEGHFFRGPHELKTAPVIERFGHDFDGLKKAATSMGGEEIEFADLAYRFPALPKVPLYYLLWEGDEEFEPRLSVLFDRSIDRQLPADAIWGLVNLVSDALLHAPDLPF